VHPERPTVRSTLPRIRSITRENDPLSCHFLNDQEDMTYKTCDFLKTLQPWWLWLWLEWLWLAVPVPDRD
jgi:hypothetical protein